MSFRLSQRSKKTLVTVHPSLQKVVNRAIALTRVDFMVGQGLRTRDEQARLYGQGRNSAQMKAAGLPVHYAKPGMPQVTWTMNSNHMSGRAVDLWAWVNGAISWDTNKGYYEEIARAMKEAAMIECVPIEWGGDWKTKKDYPHFELLKSVK